uniref:PAD1 n=1 Tax=Arundo donax TaxID=35708 RepID=A0A0A9E7I7_ARUDO
MFHISVFNWFRGLLDCYVELYASMLTAHQHPCRLKFCVVSLVCLLWNASISFTGQLKPFSSDPVAVC